jgi:hypothetical protein
MTIVRTCCDNLEEAHTRTMFLKRVMKGRVGEAVSGWASPSVTGATAWARTECGLAPTPQYRYAQALPCAALSTRSPYWDSGDMIRIARPLCSSRRRRRRVSRH